MTISDEEINQNISAKTSLVHEPFPSNTPTVDRVTKLARVSHTSSSIEQVIKLVTDASAAVCGQNSRDGFFRVRLASRARISSFESKRQYKSRARMPLFESKRQYKLYPRLREYVAHIFYTSRYL